MCTALDTYLVIITAFGDYDSRITREKATENTNSETERKPKSNKDKKNSRFSLKYSKLASRISGHFTFELASPPRYQNLHISVQYWAEKKPSRI